MTDRVFVFGSNLMGIHGKGAAKVAHKQYGAEWGVGEGRTGNAYALPTKDYLLQTRPVKLINESVEKFMEHAWTCCLYGFVDTEFQVTQVGYEPQAAIAQGAKGLAGFDKSVIAPMFKGSTCNVFFDLAWKDILGDDYNYWGTYND